ncbi:MAG: hypothetical protein JRJ87_19225 [Deltaproteobacteria bacterium]|nr:hypothetical protein [Deltaproteobacteria bacterium]
MNFVCIECGKRQAGSEECEQCGDTALHDLSNPETIYYLQDVEQRAWAKYDNRTKWIGVVIGMVIIGGLWFVPGYWAVRSKHFAIPFLLDQIFFMAAVGYLIIKVIEKVFPKRPLFDFLDELVKKNLESDKPKTIDVETTSS